MSLPCPRGCYTAPPPPSRLYSLGARSWDDVRRLSLEGKVTFPPSVQASLKHVEDLTADCIPPQEVLEMRQASEYSMSPSHAYLMPLLTVNVVWSWVGMSHLLSMAAS